MIYIIMILNLESQEICPSVVSIINKLIILLGYEYISTLHSRKHYQVKYSIGRRSVLGQHNKTSEECGIEDTWNVNF